MNERDQSHDNTYNEIKFSNKMNFYGPVLVTFSAPFLGLGLFIFVVWTSYNWSAFVSLTAGLVSWALLATRATVVLLIVGLGIKVVGGPTVGLAHKIGELAIQRLHSRLVLSHPNYVVLAEGKKLVVIPIAQERNIHNYKYLPPVIDSEQALLDAPAIPDRVDYTTVATQVPSGHTLLGIGPGGLLESRPFDVLDTLWIVGGSKSGKTNTVKIKAGEAVRAGRKLLVIDPHAGKEDCLAFAVEKYKHAFVMPIASTREEIKHALAAFDEEARRRIARGSYSDMWVLLVDEVAMLTGRQGARTPEQLEMYKLLQPIAYTCGFALRGYGMSGWFISQTAVGLSWVREVAMTVIVHKLIMENQQKAATNSNTAIIDGMAEWPRGRTYVYGLDLIGEYLLQQPLLSERATSRNTTTRLEDLRQNEVTDESSAYSSKLNNGSSPEANGEAPGSTFDVDELVSVKKQLREIGKRLQNGASVAEVVKSFELPYGRATQEMTATVNMVKSVIDEEKGA